MGAEQQLKIRKLKQCLNDWLNKVDIKKRWPCPECGRLSKDFPLRANVVCTEDHRSSLEGCHICNMDNLIEQTRRLLQSI